MRSIGRLGYHTDVSDHELHRNLLPPIGDLDQGILVPPKSPFFEDENRVVARKLIQCRDSSSNNQISTMLAVIEKIIEIQKK